jgi:hypothetical protein
MPEVNPHCFHLSASSIAAFKACPTRFRLAHREGLRLAIDTESQRIGTNWHKMHEIYAQNQSINEVIAHLNERYSEAPASKTPEEWGLERQILLTCFVGYLWYYQNDPVEVLASEVPFELPLHLPRTGLPLPMKEVVRIGKIDHVIKWQGAVCALERKSTSRGIGPDSDYWDKAKKDTQVSMYALAFRDMRGDWGQSERFGNTLYDVWHRPTIKPSMLTQKETDEFMKSGEYCGQKFTVEWTPESDGGVNPKVNGVYVAGEVGKSGKLAVKETVDMYGARLLADIQERPEFYFVRREIARTDKEIAEFRKSLFAVYQAQRAFTKSGCWFENESQCRATFPCSYIPICYGSGADAVCDGTTTPAGFQRIFVNPTVNGIILDE